MVGITKASAAILAFGVLLMSALIPRPAAALAFLPPEPKGPYFDEEALVAIAWAHASYLDAQAADASYEIRHVFVGDLPFARVLLQADQHGALVVIDERNGKSWHNGEPNYQQVTRQALGYVLVQALREGSTERYDLRVTGLHDLNPPGAGPIDCQHMGVCYFTGSVVTIESLASDPRTASIDLVQTDKGCLRAPMKDGKYDTANEAWDPQCVWPRGQIDVTFRLP